MSNSPTLSNTYEQDFHAWTVEQSGLLRAGRLSEADLHNIAEELESMGRSERRELRSRFAVLLLHLLRWQHQPNLRGNAWRSTIREQRHRLAEHLEENPSLNAIRAATMAAGYRNALLQVDRETGLPTETFPPECPYDEAQVFDPTFLPGGA